MDVFFYETFHEEERLLRQLLPEGVKAGFSSATIQASGDSMPPAKLISIRTQSAIPVPWAEMLDGIFTRAQGYNHLVDYRNETKTKIPMGYLGNYSDDAAAEHAFLAAMFLLRKFKAQTRHFETFNREDLTGSDTRNRKILVVGVGNIGSKIVRLAKGWGIPVKGVDVVKRLPDLQYVSLPEGTKWANVVMCALPLTSKTKNMLNYSALKISKPGLIVVNISRAEVSPIEDLEKLLNEGILCGVSLDVYPEEALLAEYLRGNKKKISPALETVLRLKDREECLFTPHNAFNTTEAVEKKARLSAEAVKAFLKLKKFPTPVPQQ